MSEPNFPWYDSVWLTSYVRAKQCISEHHPEKLADFIHAFEILRTPMDFKIKEVANLFDATTHGKLRDLASQLRKDDFEFHELLNFGRLVVHNHPFVSQLQSGLTDTVSDWVGEKVEPCYNFLSLYNNLGVCLPHMDAPSAKWTVDYCIQQSDPWPIYFSEIQPWPEAWEQTEPDWSNQIKNSPGSQYKSYELQERQAIVFSGSSQWHFRDRIRQKQQDNFCYLVFFHFIPQGAKNLTDQECWADLFGIPELQNIIVRETTHEDSASAWLKQRP